MAGPEFRFIHAADLHLDTPFGAIGRVAPEIADRLRDASLEAFDALVTLALEQEAAFVVIAGDAYDCADRGVRAQLRFVRGVELLGDKGVPVFVAHGNHDPLDGWSAIRHAPGNLAVFGGGSVERRTVTRGGKALAQVYGISYPTREVTANLALGFRRSDAPGLHVGVLHCNAGAQPDHPAYSPCSVAELAAAGMDYWALGHIHRHLRLMEGNPWIVYSGSLQAIKSSETGPKGAVVVEAAGSTIQRVGFAALDRVRFERLQVEISGVPDLPALRRTLLARATPGSRDVVLTIVLSGRGPLYDDLRRPGAAADLLRDVRDELGVASPFVWVDRIVDRTRAELDRVAIGRRGDFSAELTRVADGLRANAEELESMLAEPSFARFLGDEEEDPEALLAEAEERALDLLERGRER
jgi:DNA repair exonuclease SbcCD nuclease subunit